MCTLADLLPEDEELSIKQIFHVVDEAKRYRIPAVLFTGGEPFLREDIFEICDYANKQGLQTIITTNGALIDNILAEKITNLKNMHLHFSIDGLENTNDYFRGKGVFKKAVEAIKILAKKRSAKSNISLGIACTVMNENAGELSEMVRLADDLGVDVVNFQPLINNNADFSDKNTPLYWVTEDRIPVLDEEVFRIKKYKPKHVTIYEEPSLELLVKYYRGELTKRDWLCFGGFKTIFICFEKNKPLVYSCHGICGNLDEVSLKQAWRSKQAYKLRIHSKKCKNVCIQSCYSKEISQSLSNLVRFYVKK